MSARQKSGTRPAPLNKAEDDTRPARGGAKLKTPSPNAPFPRLFARAVRHMDKAILRGDAEASWRWSMIAERQLGIALKIAELDPGDARLARFRPVLAALRKAALLSEMIPPRNAP